MKKAALVTGASSGIGKVLAEHLLGQDYEVFGASRRQFHDPAEGLRWIPMDVGDPESVAAGVLAITEKAGRIDLLVNCAGFGISGALEDTSDAEAKSQFETNFFGVHRLCRAIVPLMREQGKGLIINVSSLAGLTAIPFQGFYSASKFALEAYTEALRMEVAGFGISVVLLEPGDFKTGFTSSRQPVKGSQANSFYKKQCDLAVSIMERDEQTGPDPSLITFTLDRILSASSPRLRYSVGRFSQRAGVGLKRVLPYGLYERLLKGTYGLK